MKSLVIYYSYEGNTKFIAEKIVKIKDADLLELKVEDEMTSKGFMKYVWGGRKVIFKHKPKLLGIDKNPQDYDELFIGTPVWAGNFTPAFRTFFSEIKIQGKKINLFCCHDGGKGKVLENMQDELSGNEIISKMDFLHPLRDMGKSELILGKWLGRI